MNHKFQHFFVSGGRITVVSELVYESGEYPTAIRFAVAFCSPKDIFNKQLGREIAIGRLESNSEEFSRTIPIRNNRKPAYYYLRNLIVATIFGTMDVPRWVHL
jgi:hypothetical protein